MTPQNVPVTSLAAVILLALEALGSLQMCFMGEFPEGFERIQSYLVSPWKQRREPGNKLDTDCWF